MSSLNGYCSATWAHLIRRTFLNDPLTSINPVLLGLIIQAQGFEKGRCGCIVAEDGVMKKLRGIHVGFMREVLMQIW